MRPILKTALAATFVVFAAQAAAQVTFYEHEDYAGRSFNTQRQVGNFDRLGFNDRASSVVVERGRWEACQDARFEGKCVILRPGRYSNLTALGLNDRVSSVRPIERDANYPDERYAPEPQPFYDARRRNNERLYQANVTDVRAVVGPAERRCWIEREVVSENRGRSNNVPGAIAGAVIGGILGHQVGGGTGRDIATAGGVVAGAAIGNNVGRGSSQGSRTQDVQRCENVANSGAPQYWDVTYNFRGVEHRVQMTSEPGPTVTVNRQGEPRG